MAQQAYYRPYISDSESDTSSDTDTSLESTAGDIAPNYRQFASDLQLTKAAGADFPNSEVQITLQTDEYSSIYYPFKDISGVKYVSSRDNATITHPKTESSKTTVTSIIMLDSRDRDKAVYPQPTDMSLRLPRVYQKVTNFQVVQLKLLSAFFYFRADKNNLDISIAELGRFLPDGKLNIMKNLIREGTYDIQSLINELTLQLNRTPVFYDYLNGFTDFAPLFAVSGDFSLNFNQPGDNYFDNLNDVFIQNPTMAQIVGKYFNTQTAGRISYSIDELKVAYYYPVLKELLLDTINTSTLNLTISPSVAGNLIFQETVRSRCIYTFQGLDDRIVQAVINANIPALDTYRLRNTFRYSLINKYSISYASNNNRITFSSTQLNTSLVNLLTLKYNQFLLEQLNKYGLTATNYATLSIQNNILLSILTDEYYYLQRMFSQFFGIQFNSYALDYYTKVENQLPLQNAVNNVGISSNYDSNVIINNINPQSQNELTIFRENPPYYWPNLSNLPNPTISSITNLNLSMRPSSIQEYSHPFNILTYREDEETPFINANGTIYQNRLLKSANIVAPVNPTEYTTFEFKSDVRQQLLISAFPRPTKYRYPEYNYHAYSTLKTYDLSSVKIFDNSYSFIENAQNVGMDISPTWAASNLSQIVGFTSSSKSFGISYASSFGLQTSINLNTQQNRLFYTFYTPHPPTAAATDPVTYSFAVTVSPSNLAAPMNVFLYQDRAAFMADVSDVRNEKLIHYKATQLIQDSNSRTLFFTGYSKQQYYLLVRSASTTFAAMDIRVVPYFPEVSAFTTLSTNIDTFDPLKQDPTNFIWAKVGDPNYLRLPTSQLTSNNGNDTNFSIYTLSNVPMGYDISGVSTDLTDYVGYIQNSFSNVVPDSTTRIDPMSGFIFQVGAGYNANKSVYIPNTGNAVLFPNATKPYTPQTLSNREYVVAHWYNNIFVPNSLNQPYIPDGTFSQIYTVNEFNVLTSVTSYPFSKYIASAVKSNVVIDSNLDGTVFEVNPYILSEQDAPDLQGYRFQDGKIALGNGVMGISLIPDDGVWDVKRIMLRSAFTVSDPRIDTNRGIQYLGIYFASYLNTLTGEQIKLSNALMIFEFGRAVTYPKNSNTNFGFDTVGGTYYEWLKSKTIVPASNSYLYGYAQTPRTIVTDSNSIYSIVPFDARSNITTYSLLSGSTVPYPFYSDASACAVYLDGSTNPSGKYMIRPNTIPNPDTRRGPPAGFDETQSKYEQSIPLGTSMMQYLQPPLLTSDISGCKPFGPEIFQGITGAPLFTLPNVRVSDYILMPIAGNYNIYRYENNSLSRKLLLERTVTPDVFFTNFPNMQMVSMSGNTTEFAFLGISQLANYKTQYFPPVNEVVFQIEVFNPISGQITTSDTIRVDSSQFSNNAIIHEVHSFNYNDNHGFTFAYEVGVYNPITSNFTSNIQYAYSYTSALSNPNVQKYEYRRELYGAGSPTRSEILQAPREIFGRFYVADFYSESNYTVGTSPYPKRPVLSNLYFVDTNKSATSSNSTFPIISSGSNGNKRYPALTKLNLISSSNSNYSAAFTDITLVQNPYESKIFLSYDLTDLSNNQTPSAPFYEVTNLTNVSFTESNAYWSASKQPITNYNASTMQSDKILGGGNGSFWLFFNESIKTLTSTEKYDAIWGNRGDSLDFPVNISNAYQLFYPTQRIVMTKVAPSYNPITDISGLLPFPEYPHTSMFVYDNSNKFMRDISSNKWGLESSDNFLVSDTAFSGYYFNAANLEVPLMPSTTYYVALRGYTPTEKSQVLLRFSLPNQYDFGYASINDISNEIILSTTSPTLFNSNYKNVLQGFNSNFIFGSNGKVFGSNALSGYPGSNLSNVVGFGDFLNRYITLYNIYTSNVATLNTINTAVSSNLQNFIRTDLANIIPPTAINRQRYTDPLRYDILWFSSLTPAYKKAEDNWGLGWNLGYTKTDTGYDTTHVAQSFYKILDDYINLRLNSEFDMNHMDTGAKENLQLTQETTGATKAYHAKLLLAPFGSYAQTLISNPLSFQIPIPKIDKLTFIWADNVGATINNSECEWNMVVQLVEEKDTIKAAAPPVYNP